MHLSQRLWALFNNMMELKSSHSQCFDLHMPIEQAVVLGVKFLCLIFYHHTLLSIYTVFPTVSHVFICSSLPVAFSGLN